jgi:hypothetical protein
MGGKESFPLYLFLGVPILVFVVTEDVCRVEVDAVDTSILDESRQEVMI